MGRSCRRPITSRYVRPTLLYRFTMSDSESEEEEERKEEQRAAAAKVSLTAKLIGYEDGFPQSAGGGGQQSTAELAESVVSAEHIAVPEEKVQAARDAVVLLLNGQPVQSLQRGGLTYSPVQLIDGAGDSFEVLMEAPTLLYRINAEARARKEQQIRDAEKKIADAKATLAELQQALPRNEAALAEAAQSQAAHSPSTNAELGDIGAMTEEIAKQQATLQSQQSLLQQAKSLDVDSQLTEHRVTLQFSLHSGHNAISTQGEEEDEAESETVQVLRRDTQHGADEAQFSHSAADAQ